MGLIIMKKTNDRSKEINKINKGKKTLRALLLALGIGIAMTKCSRDININPEDDTQIEETTEGIEETEIEIETEDSEYQEETESENDNEDDDIIIHSHQYSDWQYYDENNEIATCKICDDTKFREHQINKTTKIEYISNNDQTHKQITLNDCNTCDYIQRKETNEFCNLGKWKYNHITQQDERSCDKCGYTKTKKHQHSQTPSNLQYTLDKTNGNGTHKLKATYNCSICNRAVTVYKDVNCNYSESTKVNTTTCKQTCTTCGHENKKAHNFKTVPNSVTPNPTIGKHNSTERCQDCSFEKQALVSCTGDGNKYYYINGDVVTVRENCLICKDICRDDIHNHTYGNYIPVDDKNHKRVCDCTKESVEAHNYSSWELASDGQNKRTCSTCGHVQSVEHTCNLSSHNKFPTIKTKDYCYERVTECNVDGCNYGTSTPVGHNYYVESNFFGAVYSCNDCGFTYEEEYTSSFNLDDMYLCKKENEIKEETVKVLVLR